MAETEDSEELLLPDDGGGVNSPKPPAKVPLTRRNAKLPLRELYIDCCLASLLLATCIAFLLWANSLFQTRYAQITDPHPTSSVRMRYQKRLVFPAITVCNMASGVPLSPTWCGTYDNSTTCDASPVPGKPHCLNYNGITSKSLFHAETTGLAATMVIGVQINTYLYPPTVAFSGVYVHLHSQCDETKNECPIESTGTLIASPGRPVFFGMKRIVFEFLNGTSMTEYEAKVSVAGDVNFERIWGRRAETVVLGFHFATMAEMVFAETPPYSWLDLGSELGGIMGLLFGFGVLGIVFDLIKWLAGRSNPLLSLFMSPRQVVWRHRRSNPPPLTPLRQQGCFHWCYQRSSYCFWITKNLILDIFDAFDCFLCCPWNHGYRTHVRHGFSPISAPTSVAIDATASVARRTAATEDGVVPSRISSTGQPQIPRVSSSDEIGGSELPEEEKSGINT